MLPVFTISRQFGSLGYELGLKIAERLNLKVYDKELIALAAKESGLSEDIITQIDEKAGNSLLYSMVMGNFPFGRLSVPDSMPINDKLFLLQTDIIKKAANEGSCVIIGRCGNYILRNFENKIRIFIYSDKEDRIKNVVENGLCDEKKAPDFISKMDKKRATYYHFYTNEDWYDINNYDLMINMSTVKLEDALEMVLKVVESKK